MPKSKITPEIQDLIVHLHRVEGRKYKDIARQVHLDWRTVKGAIERESKFQDQEHWHAVTRQVDAQLLHHHYRTVILLALELESTFSQDPISSSQDARTLLNRALMRAVDHATERRAVNRAKESRLLDRATEEGPLLPRPLRNGSDGGASDARVARYGQRLFQALREHEPQLGKFMHWWMGSWDAFALDRQKLARGLEDAQKLKDELLKLGLPASQAATTTSGVLIEALEHKVKGMPLMEFQTETRGTDSIAIKRVRQEDPQQVREVYVGNAADAVQTIYEKALCWALQQPAVWDKLNNANQDITKWALSINNCLDTLVLRGRPAGKCGLCPSAAQER